MKCKVMLILMVLINAALIFPSKSNSEPDKASTTLILVRHAEKAMSMTMDPRLTQKGEERARELAYVLAHVSIDVVYSTPFKRTRATVATLTAEKNLNISPYKPGEEKKFLQMVLETHRGKTILISGHSNTIPKMVNILAGKELLQPLADHIYDNLFILQAHSVGNAVLLHLRFGAHTPEQ